jgi:prevent-host-death family protein
MGKTMADEITSIPASEARDRFAEITGRVQHGGERIALTKHGKTVAVLVPVAYAELLDRLEDRLLAELGEERLAEHERDPVTYSWDEVKAELDL